MESNNRQDSYVGNPWLWAIVGIVLCSLALARPTEAESSNMPRVFVIDVPVSTETIICDTKAQLITILNEINDNGLEAAEQKAEEMRTPNEVPCGFAEVLVVVKEKLEEFEVNFQDGHIVKSKVIGAFEEGAPYPIKVQTQYFWTKFQIWTKKQLDWHRKGEHI